MGHQHRRHFIAESLPDFIINFVAADIGTADARLFAEPALSRHVAEAAFFHRA